MKKITFEAHYMKGGKHIFTSIQFSGIVGIYTGFKNNAFSVSENQRTVTDGSDMMGFITNAGMILSGYKAISWVIREALETCDTFDCARVYLSQTPIIADGYIILAGLKDYEGMIISRNRFSVAHVDQLSEDRWFLL